MFLHKLVQRLLTKFPAKERTPDEVLIAKASHNILSAFSFKRKQLILIGSLLELSRCPIFKEVGVDSYSDSHLYDGEILEREREPMVRFEAKLLPSLKVKTHQEIKTMIAEALQAIGVDPDLLDAYCEKSFFVEKDNVDIHFGFGD